MNVDSFQTFINQCLKRRLLMLLSLLVIFQLEGEAQQTFAFPNLDTIQVIISNNIQNGIITGRQLHNSLGPSGKLYYDNINNQDSTVRDTNLILDDPSQVVFYVGCDTATYKGDAIQYGIDTDLDTLADLSQVLFFSVDTTFNGVPLTGTGASVMGVFKIIDQAKPTAICFSSTMANPYTVYIDTLGQITAAQLDSASFDNCTPASQLTFDISPNIIQCDSVNKSAFSVSFIVTDEQGNQDSCSTYVVVRDTLGPVFTGIPPADTIDCAETIPAQAMVTITDNCSTTFTNVVVDSIKNTQDTAGMMPDTLPGFYNYQVVYYYTATDEHNNVSVDSQVITIQDKLAPEFSIGTNDTLLVSSLAGATMCSAMVSLDLRNSITDNCADSVTIHGFRIAPTAIFTAYSNDTILNLQVPMGNTMIFVDVEDFAGNRDTLELTIIVDDNTDPNPICNNIALTINSLGFVVVTPQIIGNNSFDNCDGTPVDTMWIVGRDTFGCADVGQTFMVELMTRDAAGNTAGCMAAVSIQDFTGSNVFSCPNDTTVSCGHSLDPVLLGLPSVIDICGTDDTLFFRDDTLTGGTSPICLVVERTWVSRDMSGNETVCTQNISLIDSILPTLTMTFSDTIVNCIMDANTADSIMVTDNCATTYQTAAMDSIRCATDTIFYRRIWEATDGCNTVRDTQMIKINDVTPPTISFPNGQDTFTYFTSTQNVDSCGFIVTLNLLTALNISDCNETAQFPIAVTHSGQAAGSSPQDTAILSDNFGVGFHTIAVRAADFCGNATMANLTIQVIDDTRPTLVCRPDLIVSLGTGGVGAISTSDVLISVTDNCGDSTAIDTLFLSQSIFDCTDLGAINPVTLTARDTSGNENSCPFNVDVSSLGSTNFISIQTASQDETVIGLNDGIAWVTVTGGSGNHTVQWNDPAMSTTDTIRNLAPNLYTVVVNDATTGCQLTDTVRVNGGSMVTYQIGTIAGMPGTIVQVPITVTNFTNVTSIDMSFNLSDPTVAQFVAGNEAGGFNVPGINLTSFNIDPDDASKLLVGANLDVQTGETVPNGTVIFYVNILLSPNATIGSSVNITGGGNSETDLKTGLLINGSPVDLVAQSTSGSASVNNVNNSLSTFGGQINLINGNPLANATVVLSGDVTNEDSTGTDGVYNATVTTGQNITITPSENENARNGLSTFDLVLIQDHINLRLLPTPYQRLAADVNQSGTVTVLDIIEIQDVILKRVPNFAMLPSWVFVPADHMFADTLNPYAATVPTSITISGASAADTAMNFVAVKTGDVSLDAAEIRLRGGIAATDRNKDFTFQVKDELLREDTYLEIPFKANNFKDIRGYQMTLDIAREWLTFESVKAGALTNITKDNFSFTNSARGQIATNWFDATAQTVEDGTTLFTLVLKVNQTGNRLSEVLQITSDMIHAEAYTDNSFYNGIELVFEENAAIEEPFELFQNRPNPFRNETMISFNLPENAPVTLRFFDFSGRLVHRIQGDYTRGMNNMTVHKKDLAANGVLYYELSTPGYTARKKMVVID